MVFRLCVEPASHNVALLAAENYADIVRLLDTVRGSLGGNVAHGR